MDEIYVTYVDDEHVDNHDYDDDTDDDNDHKKNQEPKPRTKIVAKLWRNCGMWRNCGEIVANLVAHRLVDFSRDQRTPTFIKPGR